MNRKVTRFFRGIFEDLKASGRIRQDLPTYILRDALFGCTEHLLLSRHFTGKERNLDQSADHLCDLLLVAPEPDEDTLTLDRLHGDLNTKLDRILAAVEVDSPLSSRGDETS